LISAQGIPFVKRLASFKKTFRTPFKTWLIEFALRSILDFSSHLGALAWDHFIQKGEEQ